MSQTQTTETMAMHEDIIEHAPVNHLPVPTESVSAAAPAAEPSKREQARLQRASLLAEQAKLQQLLDEIEDDGAAEIADLQQQVSALKEEVAAWQAPENPHSVLAHIGLFALGASLICWLLAPLLAGQGGYLDGSMSVAATLLGYVAAALLLFVVASGNGKKH